MGFNDLYRLSVHAVILDEEERVLLIKQTYGDKQWGLPGGVEPGETIRKAIIDNFVEEGILRDCILYNGSFESLVVMSILSEEYYTIS